MSRTSVACSLAACIVGLVSATAYAHHAAAAEYDVNSAIQFKGVLTKVEWVNPHVHLFFDVKDNNGQTSNWAVECVSVGALLRAGLTKKSMTVGDTYTVVLNPGRDGRHAGLANVVTFPDGHVYRLSGAETGP